MSVFFFVPRKLKEEAATEVCHPSAETLKNGIRSHTLLVIVHIRMHSHIQTYEPVRQTNAIWLCLFCGYFPDLVKVMLQLKIIMHNMQI